MTVSPRGESRHCLTKDEQMLLAEIELKNGYMSFTHKEVNYGTASDPLFESLVEKGMLMVYDDCYYTTVEVSEYLEKRR